MIERIVSRVLAGLRFVDATTGTLVSSSLDVRALGATFVRNRSGVYVLTSAPGLAAHVAAELSPPVEPPLGSLTLRVNVRDPAGRYLPRSTRVALPRTAELARAGAEESLFRALSVPLYPSSTAAIAPGWAVVRVSVRDALGARLRRVYLRMRRAAEPTTATPPLARGMSDERGEAVLAVSGVPVTNWDAAEEGPVLSTAIDAVLEAYFDRSADEFPDPDELDARRLGLPPNPQPLPNAAQNLQLASGREAVLSLVIPA